jgi:hypothetical protein
MYCDEYFTIILIYDHKKWCKYMRKLAKTNSIQLLILAIIFFFLSHYFTVFIHEYAHAVTAWILGYKDSPLDLNYGGTSLGNLLLLMNIDQNVNNEMIYSLGHPWHVAVIAFAGPASTLLLYFLTFWLIGTKKIKPHAHTLLFLFFCNLWCLAGTYAYVPVRTFTPQGVMVDILDIQQSLHISPWTIYFFIGYLVIYMFWQFFTKTMLVIYAYAGISSVTARASLMIISVLVLFGYCGLAGFINHGEISHFISATSFYSIPLWIFFLWPSREWVQRRLKSI